jgi:hypothetical protein
VAAAIPEIPQLIEKIAFRLACDARVIFIPTLFIFRTVTNDACLHTFFRCIRNLVGYRRQPDQQ